jgi:hypothetical protein
VLLSLRDQLTAIVSPEQVVLLHTRRQWTRRGLVERVLEKKSIPCIADGEYSWSVAMQILDSEVARISPASARVILSNHFVHYAMVGWNEALSNEREAAALARHSFVQLYGASADVWELRTNQERPAAELMASGVDPRLLETLRAVFIRNKVKLVSVQPALMAVYNNSKKALRGQDAWFVQYESGNLCLALMQQGYCRSVRTMRVGEDWSAELPVILARESYLTELDVTTQQIYLWAPESGPLTVGAGWQVHRLQPLIRQGFMPDYEGRYAMAMMKL